MNKYLNKLRKIIKKHLPKEECDGAMEYYTEYFADAGFQTADDAIKEFGTPEELAQKIVEEYIGRQQADTVNIIEKKGLPMGLVIFIAIAGSPLWLGLFGIAISSIAIVFSLIVSFFAVAVAGIFGSIVVIINGAVILFSDVALGILMLGYGFLLGAAGCGFMMLMTLLWQLVLKFFKKIKSKRRENKKEKVIM